MANLGNAFMSLLLDKKARKSLENRPKGNRPKNQTKPLPLNLTPNDARPQTENETPHPSQDDIRTRLNDAEQKIGQKKSPQRLQLIQEAMRIRNEQAKVLDQLSPEQKERLQAIAINSFLGDAHKGQK